jgi:hypothetical protein
MYDALLATEPGYFATGPRSTRRPPERINPTFVRSMTARLALEAWRIDRIAQEALPEVWEEPVRPAAFAVPAASLEGMTP